MALVSNSIPNMVNGISQQPATLRLASQSDDQQNFYASVAEGLKKRPPSHHLAKLTDSQWSGAFVHTINRDSSERYKVVIIPNDILVFDALTGEQKTVNKPNGVGYIGDPEPETAYRAVTVADYTFIVNKNVTVAMNSSLTPARPHEVAVTVHQGNYGKTYRISLNGVEQAVFSTPDGSAAAHALQIDTVHIVSQLAANLNSNGYATTRFGSTIYFTLPADFAISIDDGFNGNAMSAAKNRVTRFSDLPIRTSHGHTLEVVGDDSSAFDNYWVRFDKHAGSNTNSEGLWIETIKPGIKTALNFSTMPFILVREADGTFTFKQASWGGRTVGDEESAPEPSFVNKKIKDVFFHRNRLAFIADENVIYSRAGEFFDFFAETVTTLLDSDPIDVAVSHTRVSILKYAVPFNENLLLFSDNTQFRLTGGELLTPKTISIEPTTEFESPNTAAPQPSGKNVFFATESGKYSSIMEYYMDADTRVFDAADVTAHVPKFIPKDVFKIAASTNEDIIMVFSKAERNVIWVYKYYWAGTEKLQSSWDKWVFDVNDEILNADFIESNLYMVVRRPDGVYLDKINIEAAQTDQDADYLTHLDRRVDETQCTVTYNAETDRTRYELPYQFMNDPKVVTKFLLPGQFGHSQAPGVSLPVVDAGGGSEGEDFVGNAWLEVEGDQTAVKVWIGLTYVSRYKFSPFYLREEAKGGGQMIVGEGRLQVRYATVFYEKTGYFRAEVTPEERETYTYHVTGRVLGDADAEIGKVVTLTKYLKFPIMEKNDQVRIELVNDSYLPSAFLSAEWEGMFVIRSRRT